MPLDLNDTLKMALSRTDGDVEKATTLFLRWCDQYGENHDLLNEIVKEAVERRLTEVGVADA